MTTEPDTAGRTEPPGDEKPVRDSPRERVARVLRRRPVRWALAIVLAVVLLYAPFYFVPFYNFQFSLVLVYAVALLGLNLLVGYSGQISLGHGAFFAVGAYATAILMYRHLVPYPVTIVVAGVLCFALGFAFGVPALRLRGLYLAIVTLSVALFLQPFLKRLGSLTGGAMGLTIPKPQAPAWSGLAPDQWLYYLALLVAVIMFALVRALMRSRVGRALLAIRENETAAEVMGVRLAFYKTLAFAWSAMLAGVAGAVYVWVIGFVSPDSFTVLLSITLLAGLVVGGLGSMTGAVFGAFFVEFVPSVSQDVNEAAPGIIFGLLIIVVMFAAPTGVSGLLRRLTSIRM